MVKYLTILFITIFLSSCGGTITHELNMFYYHPYYDIRVWKDENEIDLSNLKTNELLSSIILISFDEKTKKLWAFTFSKDKKYLSFYDISNGIVDVDKGINIERPEKFDFCQKIYNNKILYGVDDGNFQFIDLITKERTSFVINDVDGKRPMRYPSTPIAFSDDKVLFENGYYSILEKKYYFFSDLKYPRLIANEEKAIGLNNNNYIVIYDLKTKNIENTNIKRKMQNAKYNGDDLYFIENSKLYISKDIIGLNRLIEMFLPIGYSNRKWFHYDFKKQKLVKIFTPHDMVYLLGSI